MTELEQYLETIQPELINTARLFGIPDSAFGENSRFAMTAEERDGKYEITFRDGERAVTGRAEIPDAPDARTRELHRKRAARRLCKQILYDLCREVTGIHPPWGSLTGVRPTHLMLESLAAGMSGDGGRGSFGE